DSLWHDLPEALCADLVRLAREERCTLFMTLLAAFQVLLSRYSGQEDFCVGSPIAGRDQVELEPLIGFFLNTLVLRADLSGHPSSRDLLRRVRAPALDAYAMQEIPFERLINELDVARDLSRTPLFDVMLNLQSPEARGLSIPGVAAEPYDAGLLHAKL